MSSPRSGRAARFGAGAAAAALVAGGLLDAAWSPDQLYLGYGLAFVLAAVIVSMHRIAGPLVAHSRAASETVAAH